jgi:hypothetical protein
LVCATHAQWYDGLTHALGYAAGLAGGLAAAIVVLAALRGVYRRTLGRRRDRYGRVDRLGTNAQLSFFTAVLGEPPAMRRSLNATLHRYSEEEQGEYLEQVVLWENVYVDRDFYVQVLTDIDNSVLGFAVTTRSNRFRPKLVSPGSLWHEPGWLRRRLRLDGRLTPIFKVRLSKTRFRELGQPMKLSGGMGAHTFSYWEAHWLGNPGNYQYYVFGVNDAGAKAFDSASVLFPPESNWEVHWRDDAGTDFHAVSHLASFRRAAVINTYAVIGPTMTIDDYPLPFGPEVHHVRTIP